MDRFARSGALVAAGLVAALALTACGSDDADTDTGKDSAAEAGAEESAMPGGSGGADESGDAGTTVLDGTWAGTSESGAVVLSVASGKAALVADQHVCQGDVKDMGEVTLSLTCADGNTERTEGAVESHGGKTLVISWAAGAEDTLTRADPGKMPSGLPEMPMP